MKFSESWLRDWLECDLDVEAMARTLTMAGLEVETVERAGPALKRVVVGRVVDLAPHPHAGRLTVCRVDVGAPRPLNIVCGAPNARRGLVAATALPGAVLPGGARIARSDIRGVDSTGMLCSAAELHLGDDAGGLLELDADATPGVSVADYLDLGDNVIDIELTPNRGDCLSILGIARELVVLADGRLKRTHLPGCAALSAADLPITLEDPAGCPRYVGRVIEDIDLSRMSPARLRERLRRCGIRPISAAVDVTNYVMLEIGQPMHAFDLDRLHGGIIVRRAAAGERLQVLDGSELTLDAETLVIADHRGAVAVAGVMGGMDSAIGANTRSIVLEAAHFSPRRVAGRARRFGLHSDSAYRFERGVHPDMPYAACQYATALLMGFTGGTPGPVIDRTRRRHLPGKPAVTVRHARALKLLGMPLSRSEITRTLSRIAPGRVVRKKDTWRLTPPGYRFDIQRECDLIEEIARVHGYHRVPASMPRVAATSHIAREAAVGMARLKQVLADRDYHEVITYSFVDPAAQRGLMGDEDPIRLQNPLAPNMAVMRTTLWTGLLDILRDNVNRQHRRIRLFEVGKTFHKTAAGVNEVQRIGGVACGPAAPEQWGADVREVDFFDIKGDLEAILGLTRKPAAFEFHPLARPALHPGQSARVVHAGGPVGAIGRLHPEVAKQLDIGVAVYLFELDLGAVSVRRLPRYNKISKFPAIRRDLAVLVDNAVPAARVLEIARGAAGEYLTNLELFDVFRREDIDSKRKSLAFGLTLQASSRTLTDREVDAIVARTLDALRDQLHAELRT